MYCQFFDGRTCGTKARYCIEWWSYNQLGENPILNDEIYVCSNPEHIIKASHHQDFGGYPDRVYCLDEDKPEESNSRLLDAIKEAMDNPEDTSLVERVTTLAKPVPRNQLSLFPD